MVPALYVAVPILSSMLHVCNYLCRAEMDLPAVSVRFGLMLEAYCRGCGSYRNDLNKQYVALDAMRQISSNLQKTVSPVL